MCCFVQG
jgi:hypothetical protein